MFVVGGRHFESFLRFTNLLKSIQYSFKTKLRFKLIEFNFYL